VLLPIRDINPRTRFPVATLGLVLANALVYLLGMLSGSAGQLIDRAGFIPLEITTLRDLSPHNLVPPPLTIVSAMFLHTGPLHLLGNMWFLWIFGDNLEEWMRPPRYLAFYLATGAIGALAQCALTPGSPVPMVGASGAVAGALGGYTLLFPRSRVVAWVVVGFLSLPAWIFLGLWFLTQLLISFQTPGTAWMVHVGGFLAGVGLVRVFATGPPSALTVERR
jgi:membrane associated rhomboid family serine protease